MVVWSRLLPWGCSLPRAVGPVKGAPHPRRYCAPMPGLSVGVVGVGGVGVATASALVMRGLAGRVTIYSRDGTAARGLALDFMHARPLLSRVEVRGHSMDEIEPEDILVVTAGHHTKPGESRLDILHENIAVID